MFIIHVRIILKCIFSTNVGFRIDINDNFNKFLEKKNHIIDHLYFDWRENFVLIIYYVFVQKLKLKSKN